MRLKQTEFKVLQLLQASRIFANNEGTVHLMLSGGKDSVALLELFSKIQHASPKLSDLRIEVVAHHFNHKQRGAESDADERHCVDLAKNLGIPIQCQVWTTDLQEKTKSGENFHAVARAWRYQSVSLFAEQWSRRHDLKQWVIATAHHRRDHAETVLQNIVRGCGPTGMHGIKTYCAETRLLRPFLWIDCENLDSYISNKTLTHREDESNQSSKYTRNRLRHWVLPELEKLNPRAVEHFWSLSLDMQRQAARPHGDTPESQQVESSGSEEKSTVRPVTQESKTVHRIDVDQITDIAAMHEFLATATRNCQVSLSRDFLQNLMTHLHKLSAGRTNTPHYIFALSEDITLVMSNKHLEIEVTS